MKHKDIGEFEKDRRNSPQVRRRAAIARVVLIALMIAYGIFRGVYINRPALVQEGNSIDIIAQPGIWPFNNPDIYINNWQSGFIGKEWMSIMEFREVGAYYTSRFGDLDYAPLVSEYEFKVIRSTKTHIAIELAPAAQPPARGTYFISVVLVQKARRGHRLLVFYARPPVPETGTQDSNDSSSENHH